MRDHVTDGKPCWCGPQIIKEGEAQVIVHRQIPECPNCTRLEVKLSTAREALKKIYDFPEDCLQSHDCTHGYCSYCLAKAALSKIAQEESDGVST